MLKHAYCTSRVSEGSEVLLERAGGASIPSTRSDEPQLSNTDLLSPH